MNSEKWVFNILFLVYLFFGLCNSTSDTITPNQPIKDGELLVSNGKTFALGFFSPGNGTSNRRYVGIWYYKISEQTVVWVANQDNPINGKSGVISINQDGNLVIYDDDNTHNVTWDTNISTAAATNSYYSARLLDSGNLVVSNSSNNSTIFVWQSFD
ncbi:G-type lectin S-receptor-like serine/threonine-protein kinase At1g11300 [Camellia sinensis]|uniref:G-type lectin S-receptor-like serine/threonine-protein kinase At1g11300 n=1 Tax=Camellia sinensis TaxID=4442 RepID=UPI0010367633|nr:G-type lectin S-receptor-like serine/threonine-protein kinase At1g11300 [Camellia sinensis]